MKVLLVHNEYRSTAPSGEDAVVAQEESLLRSRGVDVVAYRRSNDELQDALRLATAGPGVIWSRRTYREVRSLLRRERPDVAHVHNLWYAISPSVYTACHDAGIPLVQTLHNFRMFCANGLLLRQGEPCEDCVGHLPWRGLLRGCFRTRLHSLPLVAAESFHRVRGTWARDVDAYVALSRFARERFIACGLPASRVFIKPNFLAASVPTGCSDSSVGLYLGRLSHEKGVEILLLAAQRSNAPLRVLGDGPLRAHLTELKDRLHLASVELLGRRTHEEALQAVSSAGYVVLPSVCYENFPMAILEASACGKPVIASRRGSIPELVEDGETGFLFEPGDSEDLAAKMALLAGDPVLRKTMGERARAMVRERYSANANFALLMDLYRSLRS